MLTVVHLLIAQFPADSGPSFFFLEVLSTLQKNGFELQLQKACLSAAVQLAT